MVSPELRHPFPGPGSEWPLRLSPLPLPITKGLTSKTGKRLRKISAAVLSRSIDVLWFT